MNFFSMFKKNYFNFFLIFYFFIIVIASLNTGITHDERFELHNFQLNKNIISNFFLNTNLNTDYLYGTKTYMNAFYGIGFHLFSYPIEKILNLFNLNFELTEEGKLQLVKHPAIIILFVISGIYFKKIVFLTTSNKNFSSLSAIIFLLYPYLLGHNFFNVKDAPFMSVWLICTFYIIDLVKNFLKKNEISTTKVIFLAILTSFLISIKIVGILIFFEFLIFIIFLFYYSNLRINIFLKKIYKPFIIYLSIIVILTYLLNPHFWYKPLIFISAIDFFKNHVQTVCTLTLGECMKAQSLPSSYLPIWLFFKLPIVVLVGLFIFPLVERKIFALKSNSIIIGSLGITVFGILFILIIFNAVLYDELRHILFLVPIILIISFTSIYYYFSKKIITFFFVIYVLFFAHQNIKLFPYNYIWINNFSNFINVTKNFELDYWGVSTKSISNFFKNQEIDKDCIISNRNETIEYYLIGKSNQCFIDFKNMDKKNIRPFFIALLERRLDKSLPDNCFQVYEEKVNLNFSRKKLVMARVFKCE